MKMRLGKLAVWILTLSLFLCACGTESESETAETTLPTEPTVETTEQEIELDPEWISEAAIDEAISYLFPLEGEKNIALAQEILLPLVEIGNAEAQYYWGYIYDFEITDNNGDEEKESLIWYELAADQGVPKAYLAASLNTYVESEERKNELVELAKQSGLFEMTPEELGPDGCEMIGSYYHSKNDYQAAMEWFLNASEMGCSGAMLRIGLMYYDGMGVDQNYAVSADWLLKAAHRGDIYAMSWYGYILHQDNVVYEIINKKYASFLEEYLKAADAGDPIAMRNIGYMHENGYGGLSRNSLTALAWYQQAADAGDAYSMYKIGDMYRYGNHTSVNYKLAMEWYQKAAELGNADAMWSIGHLYKEGLGVAKDEKIAKEWGAKWRANSGVYEKGGNKGYLDYDADKKEIQNMAMEWLRKAADEGDASAMSNVGYYGYGGKAQWYQMAADEGNPVAMFNLAQTFYSSKMYDSAMEWFIKAYVNGVDYAADDINNMLLKKQGVNAYFENYGQLISVAPQ